MLKFIVNILTEMPPGISRLFKLQPVMALLSGSIVTFLMRRGFEHIPYVIVFFIFAFFALTFRLYLFKDNTRLMSKVTDFAVMFLINDMLLFILPFYFESMTFLSRNMFFGIVIISLAVITNWYYLYEKLILKNIFISSVYYALVFFCVLNFIFPIILGIRNIYSLLISAGISALTALIFIYPYLHKNKNRRNVFKFISGILLAICFIWFGRSFIPPAPLKLLYVTACENIENHVPVFPYETHNIENIQEAFFFSSIFAPKGLKERIFHKWYYNSHKLFTVNLNEITGGRKEGYRTWSKHLITKGEGEYTVEVWTAGGQLLGKKTFIINKSKSIPNVFQNYF